MTSAKVFFLSLILGITGFLPSVSYDQANENTVTFDNQSGDAALVKLVGPTTIQVEVQNTAKEALSVSSGDYQIFVRYGSNTGAYRYSKGESFSINPNSGQYEAVSITLHKVVGGNYESTPITADAFSAVEVASGNDRDVAVKKGRHRLDDSPQSGEAAPSNREFLANETPTSSKESMFILSFPSSAKVYLVSEDKLGNYYNEQLALSAKENFVGVTPLKVDLEAGRYRVAVGDSDKPMWCNSDGSKSLILVLERNGFQPAFRIYSFNKEASHAGILVSLCWPEDQTLEEYVHTLPSQDLFDLPEGIAVKSFNELFEKHQVPQRDWKLLERMFKRTGKLVWHSSQPSSYLIFEFIGLDENGKPKWLGKQPVMEGQ